MSARLIELLLRMMGRMRGGLNLIMIFANRVFLRRLRLQARRTWRRSRSDDAGRCAGRSRDPNEAAGLLAARR